MKCAMTSYRGSWTGPLRKTDHLPKRTADNSLPGARRISSAPRSPLPLDEYDRRPVLTAIDPTPARLRMVE